MQKGIRTIKTVKGKDLEEFTDIPKVGEIWTDIHKSGDQIMKWNWYFVGAFTGKAKELLEKTRDYGTTYSYHTINGKEYIFFWGDIGDHETMPADYEEVTIKIPKNLVTKIKAEAGKDAPINAKVQEDIINLYAQL